MILFSFEESAPGCTAGRGGTGKGGEEGHGVTGERERERERERRARMPVHRRNKLADIARSTARGGGRGRGEMGRGKGEGGREGGRPIIARKGKRRKGKGKRRGKEKRRQRWSGREIYAKYTFVSGACLRRARI